MFGSTYWGWKCVDMIWDAASRYCSREVCVLVRMGDGNDRSANAYFVKHSAKGETIYSKGNENKGEVTSANSNSYPTNGYEDGIWYVYKGEY